MRAGGRGQRKLGPRENMAQTELPTAVFETFQRSPLSSELLAPGILPGAGKITCDKLIKREITSAVALMGYYLLLNRNNDAFISFLVATDVQKRCAGMHARRAQHERGA